jgi:acyl-homoserine-lactone acylase
MPSLWNLMHVRCKDYDVAGIGIAGVPSLVAGYNGHIAWGMTMVMADNQDIFLERLKEIDGKLHYLYEGKWMQAVKREETIAIRGRDPLRITVYETIHGPLLNDALKKAPKSPLQPLATRLPLGIALSWAAFEPGDKTMEAFYGITRSRSVSEAMDHAEQIRAIALNMVMADHDNIAWQVTGRYPLRKKGRGIMPSPGWTGEYDWEGFLDADKHPFSLNPSSGFFGTANDRTVPADFPHILSSTWYWPERGERIAEMITSTDKHTLQTSMDMQLDTFTLFTDKLKKTLLEGNLHSAIKEDIDSWKDEKRQQKAQEAMEMLRRFDGCLTADSRQAPIVGALLYTATLNTFSDELGPKESSTWASFIANINIGYCAASDHLAVRGDESPFWDDVTTPEKETKAQILARSFADSIDFLEKHLGKDRSEWTWGRLHTYYWKTEASKMSQHMSWIERFGMKLLSPYFNRGPFPAPGDHTTLNVSGYDIARNFDTWLIPAVRMIADFSLEEPFVAMNSSGQSDNPASPHYDDGIHEWLQGNYRPMPFKQENIENQYNRVLVLKPSAQ